MTHENQPTNLAIIILAAGAGKRMMSDTPKVMHQIAGKYMLEYVLDTARQLQPKTIIPVISQDIRDQYPYNLHNYVVQDKPLGTGDAIKQALSQINSNHDKVLILYGDHPMFNIENIKKVINLDVDVAIMGFHCPPYNQYGKLVTDGEKVLEIIEAHHATETQQQITLSNSGIMAIKTKALQQLIPKIEANHITKEYYLTDIVSIAHQHHYSTGYTECSLSEARGVNTPLDLIIASSHIQQTIIEKLVNQGAIFADLGSTITIHHDTIVGTGTHIEQNNVIGPNVKIGKNCTIRAFCYLENCTIEDNAMIGPYARIRPNSKISSQACIGNFVEIKNSTIGTNSKVSHHSYIGDSIIGNNSNIGAGTITCNYDGKKKHTTIIGDHCLIGANNSLIAPLNIGHYVTTGAGTTVISNIPDRHLTLSRPPQVNLNKQTKNKHQT